MKAMMDMDRKEKIRARDKEVGTWRRLLSTRGSLTVPHRRNWRRHKGISGSCRQQPRHPPWNSPRTHSCRRRRPQGHQGDILVGMGKSGFNAST